MKEILILSENKKWKSEMAELFNKNKEHYPIKWTYVSSRTDIISELSIRFYDAVIINSELPISNLQIIFKYLASTDYKEFPIFFISEDFSKFEELLAQTQFPQMHLISAPVDNEFIFRNIESVLFPPKTAGPVDAQVKINLDFLKTFIDATKYILESFCQLNNITHTRPYLYDIKTARKEAIEGRIYLKSSFFEGEFIIGFDTSTYLAILKIVLSQDDKEITKENEDFAGEIVNMIYGQAKTILNVTGHNFEKVIPIYEVNPPKHLTKDPIVVVPLKTEAGIVELMVCVTKIKREP